MESKKLAKKLRWLADRVSVGVLKSEIENELNPIIDAVELRLEEFQSLTDKGEQLKGAKRDEATCLIETYNYLLHLPKHSVLGHELPRPSFETAALFRQTADIISRHTRKDSDLAKKVLDIIRSQPPGSGITCEGLVYALKMQHGHSTSVNVLTSHIIRPLKENYGVKNDRDGNGYYIPKDTSPQEGSKGNTAL